MGLEKPPVGRKKTLVGTIQQLEMLRLQEESLLPEKVSFSLHFFSFSRWIS
jgi:hypothetical protein